MKKKPTPLAKGARRRRRAGHAGREFPDQREDRPRMLELYRRAEGQLRKQEAKQTAAAGVAKVATGPERLLHELQVHQIELELQNAELQQARNELEAALEDYTDLYDFAPVGYLSIDQGGVILQANLTGATLLGLDRASLLKRRLLQFVAPASRPLWLAFLANIFGGEEEATCDVRLLRMDRDAFWATLRATSAVSLKGTQKWCRVAFGDVTARKAADEALRESEKRYRTLFELFPAAVYSCDAAGAIQNFNQRRGIVGAEPGVRGYGGGVLRVVQVVPPGRQFSAPQQVSDGPGGRRQNSHGE